MHGCMHSSRSEFSKPSGSKPTAREGRGAGRVSHARNHWVCTLGRAERLAKWGDAPHAAVGVMVPPAPRSTERENLSCTSVCDLALSGAWQHPIEIFPFATLGAGFHPQALPPIWIGFLTVVRIRAWLPRSNRRWTRLIKSKARLLNVAIHCTQNTVNVNVQSNAHLQVACMQNFNGCMPVTVNRLPVTGYRYP
jgi:hypothetical protein